VAAHEGGCGGLAGQVSGGAGSLCRSAAPRLAGQVSGDAGRAVQVSGDAGRAVQVSGDAGRAVLVSGDAARRAGSGRAADVWAKARPRRGGVGASMSGQICTGTKAGPGLAEGLLEVQAVEVTGRTSPPGPAGRAEGDSLDAGEYSAFFNRSFNGGDLRAPLYKGPLVQ
jgi:hypothetical protein